MDEYAPWLERRSAPRHSVALPVRFSGGEGITRNVSATGVYFVTACPFEEGQPVSLSLTFSQANGTRPVDVTCRGFVRRVETVESSAQGEGARGVAVSADTIGFDNEWSSEH
jgi:hypothetical protein